MSMYKIVNGERIEMTEEEIQQLRQEQAAFEAYEKSVRLLRPKCSR